MCTRPISLLSLAFGLLLAGATLLIASTAAAQSSPISELWREWAVLEKQWRVEKAEAEIDRRRLRARREGRDPDAPKAPDRRRSRR